ncbi:MAG: hypothetical protein AAF215_13835 [Cyanobacteria bacterium P01_A01_bin.123]
MSLEELETRRENQICKGKNSVKNRRENTIKNLSRPGISKNQQIVAAASNGQKIEISRSQ